MKPIKVFLTVVSIVLATEAYSQRANRGDICQNIPDLTTEQKQKLDKLSTTHQKSIDGLRTKFYAETDAAKALEIKTQMNTETANHYRNISGLLSPEQQTWFDQQCFANSRRGYGRGMGYGPGQGFGRGQGYGRAQGCGRGMGYYGRGQGRGRGMGRVAY